MSDAYPFSRRIFLAGIPGVLTLGLNGPHALPDVFGQGTQVPPNALSPEEQARVRRSSMARELGDYFGEGYSCAESILMTALRFLNLPEETVWAAAGFGGGMGQRDLCGFLTGGIMSLGLTAGTLDMPREQAKARCAPLVDSFWTWWNEQAPCRCAEIRLPGSPSGICRRLGALAAARVQELIRELRD